jgi:sugar lactone lactonase YvrE
MSNLTDLLPAGAGGKQVDFVASGTIGNGVTVALKADGTVEAVSATGGGAEAGSPVVFEADTLYTSDKETSVVFDPVNNKIVIAYADTGNSGYGTAIVGTVSGTSISFGTPVVFESASTANPSMTFDSNANKVVIAYRDIGASLVGTAIVGTVSGTSISFGSPTVFNSGTRSYNITSVFDSNSNKVVIFYRDWGNSNYGTAIVATVSGTSISFGSEVVFNSASSSPFGACFDSSNNKTITPYTDFGNSSYGTAIVGTVSGTSISFGTATVFKAAAVASVGGIVFNSSGNKTVIAYKHGSYTLSAVVGTVSGTSISFGSEANIGSYDVNSASVTYDSSANKVVVLYNADGTSYTGYASVGEISGTNISFDPFVAFSGAQTYAIASAFDSSSNKVVIGYTDANNSSYGTSVVLQTESTNNTSFIGITDAAISDTASGSVTIKGGISTNVTGLTPNALYYVQDDGSLVAGATSIPFDISSASFVQSFSVAAQDSIPRDVVFNSDGTKMFILGDAGNKVHQYALSTGFDVSTASFVQSLDISNQGTAPEGLAFNADGTKMFVSDVGVDAVNQYALSTGFDISTASFSQSFSVSGQDTVPTNIAFNTDGTKMFILGDAGNDVNEYSLTTGFDISTASFVDSFSVAAQETSPNGLVFNSDGTKMFVVGFISDIVFQYNLATGFDVSTASYSSISFNVASQDGNPTGIAFNTDGTKMFIVGYQTDSVGEYTTTQTTFVTTVLAGKALSSTSINLDYTT